MNLGYAEREISSHWPAVNADMSKIVAFRRAYYVLWICYLGNNFFCIVNLRPEM